MARHAKPVFEKRKGHQLESAVAKRRRTQGKVPRLEFSLQGDFPANKEPLPTEDKVIRQPTLSSWLRSGKCGTSPAKNHGNDGQPKATVNVGSSSSGPAGTESAAQPVSGAATRGASTDQVDDLQDKAIALVTTKTTQSSATRSTGTTTASPTQQAPRLPPPSSPRPSITYRELWLARPRREAINSLGIDWSTCTGGTDDEAETDDEEGSVEKEEEEEEEESQEEGELYNRERLWRSLSPMEIRLVEEA
ncbi:hypothetical protein QBC37DRAFT_399922 [Rhypophila decipiens]|uniref:Uncharacterized protein n=1 Tax=Rhypophila decipiens TaxID=261697 RepID=A0AAN6Y7N9_9PEZI|nr:hypothetical protein QBC37DRAFT_399922 [Rhypophila decipiens]